MNLNPEQFEEMLAAYALDVLEPEERTAFEAQLAAAPQYQAQLSAYENMLASLATLTPAVAEPVGHRERMMAKLNAATAAAPASETTPATVQATAGVPLPAILPPTARKSPQPGMMQASAGGPIPTLPPTARKSPQPGMMQRITAWFSQPGRASLAVAGLSLVLVIGMVFWNLGLQSDVTKYQQQANNTANQMAQVQAAVDLLGQPGTVVKALPGNNTTAYSQLIANDSQKRGVLLAYNLQPVTSDKTYEFWLLDKSGNPIPAGTFNVDQSGKGVLNVNMPKDVPMSNLSAGAVTIEPAGGLPKPTGKILMVGNF